MYRKVAIGLALATIMSGATGASAQLLPRSPILDMTSKSAMRTEVDRRYETALQATLTPDVVRANDDRYTWASEAKVACGIAIGYFKNGTVHEESINKCDDFSRRMTVQPPVAPVVASVAAPVVAEAQSAGCTVSLPMLIFFDWNVDVPPPETQDVVAKAVAGMATCGWPGLRVTGHADRSGTDAYNLALSERRARNVASEFAAAGISADKLITEAKGEGAPFFQTMDDVREPQNRRVEINVAARPISF